MGARNNMDKEEFAIAKRVKKIFVFNVNSSNTDTLVNPTVDNNKSLSGNNSVWLKNWLDGEMAESYVFHQLLRIGYKMPGI